jgi:hypothetical protein
MKEIKGLFAIKWVEGLDKYGNTIKYQSLVEVPEIIPTNTHKTKCYHDWDDYLGFLQADRTCKICGIREPV